MKRYWPLVLLILAAAFKRVNGIAEDGFGPLDMETYTFWDDLGNDLAMLCCAVTALLMSHRHTIGRYASLFLTGAVVADTLGLVFNPDHYDGWLWECGCAVFGALVSLGAYLLTKRRHRASYGYPPVMDNGKHRIGFQYRGRK